MIATQDMYNKKNNRDYFEVWKYKMLKHTGCLRQGNYSV